MFNPFSHEDHGLEIAIENVYKDLKKFSSDEDEYQKALNQLVKLYALKNQADQLNLQAQTAYAAHQLEACQAAWQEELERRPFYMRVDPNTALTVAGNIFIGLAVIKYEQTGVIASKVMTFMRKI